MKRSQREIEVKEYFVDTDFGVEKIKCFGIVRDGFDNQVTIRGEMNYCCVVSADKLEVWVNRVLVLQAFYFERELNLGGAMTTLHHRAIGYRSPCEKQGGREENE